MARIYNCEYYNGNGAIKIVIIKYKLSKILIQSCLHVARAIKRNIFELC